jgi:RNA polymerase sigma-70 factor (ECF subfamily)
MGRYSLALRATSAEKQTDRSEKSAPVAANADTELFDRFLAGDDRAFIELFDCHNHRLFLYCLKLVGDADQAEDLTQELWERVIRLRQKPQKVLNPTGFLLTIARNLCLNHLRSNRRTSSIEDVQESALPSASMREMSELEELVLIALNELPMEMREVLILYTYSGYRFDEIATMLGKSVDAVRMRASRARALLRKQILEMKKNDNTDYDRHNDRRIDTTEDAS